MVKAHVLYGPIKQTEVLLDPRVNPKKRPGPRITLDPKKSFGLLARQLETPTQTSQARIETQTHLERERVWREKMMADGHEDEEKWLAAGIAGLQQNAFYMHRALVNSLIP